METSNSDKLAAGSGEKTFSSGRYIESIETRLKSGNLTPAETAILNTNIAAAQHELGLYRKCIQSCQSAIDACPSHARAHILKGKALVASGKKEEALQLWSAFLGGDIVFCDVLLVQEMRDLVAATGSQHAEQSDGSPDSSVDDLSNTIDAKLASQSQPVSKRKNKSKKSAQPIESTSRSTTISPSQSKAPSPTTTTTAAGDPKNTAPKERVVRPVVVTEDSTTSRTESPRTTQQSEGGSTGLPAVLLSASEHSDAVAELTKAAAEIFASLGPSGLAAMAKSLSLDTARIARERAAQGTPTISNVNSNTNNNGTTNTTNSSLSNNKMSNSSPSAQTQPASPPPTSTSSSVAAVAPTAKVVDKAKLRRSLVDFHAKNIGSSGAAQVKPLFLNAMKANLPHLCGEDLVDDLVGFGYINVNAGKHTLALTVFKLLLEYRPDLPSALIGLGSIHAMQRQLDLAITELTAAIEIDDTIADAWKRRGQTKAAKQLIRGALRDLTKALSLQCDADIYNQRGLVFNQAKNYARALADFRCAQAKGLNTAPLLNYIGMCEGQLGNVAASIESHQASVALDPKLREAYLNMALMYKEVGQWREANVHFTAAIAADQSRYFSQAHNYRSVMWYQIGRPAQALRDTEAALLTLKQAIAMSQEVNATQTEDLLQNLIRAAVCCQALGQYARCVDHYDHALIFDPTNNCWFQREIALFFWAHLDADLSGFSADDRVDPRLKDGWCKHVPYRDYMTKALVQQVQGVSVAQPYTPQQRSPKIPSLSLRIEDDSVDADHSDNRTITAIRHYEHKARLVELAKPLGAWIQLQTPGFLPNRRQHRMFGLAVLQMARALRRHIVLIQLEGVGLEVLDSCSSKVRVSAEQPREGSPVTVVPATGKNSKSGSSSSSSSSSSAAKTPAVSSSQQQQPSSGKRGSCIRRHTLGWRDLYDMAVRWRQVSEPNDPVWWIDRFPAKAFGEGFGLQTPIVNTQMKTVRYYPYFPLAFATLKELMRVGYYSASDRYEQLEMAQMERFEAAATLSDIAAITQKDFYVVVPCPSLSSAGLVLEGTRLTLVAREPEGFEFTIRTPGRPYRWRQFEAELDASFQRLEDVYLAHSVKKLPPATKLSVAKGSGPTAAGDDEEEVASTTAEVVTDKKTIDPDQMILRQSLEMFYLWVTFAPLSRGTAACGYAALMAMLLAHGKLISAPLPVGKQLDWEAIFAKDCAAFVDKVAGWFVLSDGAELCAEGLDDDLAAITTLRDMIEVLALPYDQE